MKRKLRIALLPYKRAVTRLQLWRIEQRIAMYDQILAKLEAGGPVRWWYLFV